MQRNESERLVSVSFNKMPRGAICEHTQHGAVVLCATRSGRHLCWLHLSEGGGAFRNAITSSTQFGFLPVRLRMVARS